MMFSRYFRPFVPGFRVRPQNDVPGFNLDENGSPRAGAWRASPQLFAQSTPSTGLAGFRATTQDDVPGFKLRLEDAMPGFNLIDNESGVQRQETTWSDGTRPDSRPPAWLYKLLTMPVPQLSTAFDPQTGRRIVPYAPLINAGGTYPTTGENEHMTGSTLAYVDETSAPPDSSSVSAPSAEEWPSTDADEWPSPDAEQWPPSDTEEWPSSDAKKWPPSDAEVQSQAPSTAPARAPSPQQAVQQATWEAQLPRPTNSQLHSEGGGNKNFEDPRSAPMARLPSGIAAPSVRPIADNNFILANARDDAIRQHASANGGSPFGQESVYGVGPNNALRRGDIPASTGIRNSVIASFSFPAAPAHAAYQSYGTNSAHPTPFEYRGQPFDAKVGNTFSPRNLPLHCGFR